MEPHVDGNGTVCHIQGDAATRLFVPPNLDRPLEEPSNGVRAVAVVVLKAGFDDVGCGVLLAVVMCCPKIARFACPGVYSQSEIHLLCL